MYIDAQCIDAQCTCIHQEGNMPHHITRFRCPFNHVLFQGSGAVTGDGRSVLKCIEVGLPRRRFHSSKRSRKHSPAIADTWHSFAERASSLTSHLLGLCSTSVPTSTFSGVAWFVPASAIRHEPRVIHLRTHAQQVGIAVLPAASRSFTTLLMLLPLCLRVPGNSFVWLGDRQMCRGR
ncbi:hypothetical protein BDY17DRAFT_304034 [Neohortaea acidophila]|uniref:Uncharacterized protein n=1 Tax=Neohortaea acidophila TaxID=245834 RepID=A0A6A6PIH6_9PEZI|nr:uncharacterized protein BDY17DRAFT_304034 [Neohortaea acidophila]KAF2479511.1 hypothetical protein BDY17DRAFT_304034 [Neohortaea acidophila]